VNDTPPPAGAPEGMVRSWRQRFSLDQPAAEPPPPPVRHAGATVQVWAARNPYRTRMRIDTEPFMNPWHGGEDRSGEIPGAMWDELFTATDEVARERAHQEIWLRLR
jgi:hypothetical protein